MLSFSKSSVFKMFYVHKKTQTGVLNFSSLKSVFEKLRFRDGLVWTVGLTGKMKLRLQVWTARNEFLVFGKCCAVLCFKRNWLLFNFRYVLAICF